MGASGLLGGGRRFGGGWVMGAGGLVRGVVDGLHKGWHLGSTQGRKDGELEGARLTRVLTRAEQGRRGAWSGWS